MVPGEHLGKGNWEHQNEFTSMAQLREFLSRDFSEIQINMTVYPVVDERRAARLTPRKLK